MSDLSVRHSLLVASVNGSSGPGEDLDPQALALWAVLQETGRAIFASENGAYYPLSASTIDRLIAECLWPEADGSPDA